MTPLSQGDACISLQVGVCLYPVTLSATRHAAVLENTLGIHAAGLTKPASYVDPMATWD